MRPALALLPFFLLLPAGAAAQEEAPRLHEEIAVGLSQSNVAITADFSGEEILVYGAIVRNRLLREEEPSPDVILIVKGPERSTVVRKKERLFGIWVNRENAVIQATPSFYAVGSTRPLLEALDPHQIEIHDIGLEQTLLVPGEASRGGDPAAFRDAAVRLLLRSGAYRQLPESVQVPGDTLFSSRIRLPANTVEGDYLLRVLLVRNRQVIDSHELILPVRRAALESWIYRTAQDDPLGYALASILIAILAGWAASALFRRFRF